MENKENKNLMPDVEEVLEYLGLSNLEPKQKEQVVEGLMKHFSEIIVETLTDNLNEDQAETLVNTLNNEPQLFEAKVEELSSQVPGLYAKIQMAVTDELRILKSGYSQIQ
jgi:hypothetical protein